MFRDQSWLARLIWLALIIVALGALGLGRWSLGFVALLTLALSLLPVLVARWAAITVPPSFIAAIVLFVGGTVFLGEVFNFYERYWWWDIAMHGGSAIGFGLVGFVLVFMMFQGDRFAATPLAVAFFAFCFGITIGTTWEVFEFAMDQLFGLNMQKSGLMDTMGDLIVDGAGAFVGASAGYGYMKGRAEGGLPSLLDEFVRKNPRLFRRFRK